MSFFPNLGPAKGDRLKTTNINYSGTNIPELPSVAYYASKKVRGLDDNVKSDVHKANIEDVCNISDWKCDYIDIIAVELDTGSHTDPSNATFKTASVDALNDISKVTFLSDPTLLSTNNIIGSFDSRTNDTEFINDFSTTNLACQLPNILVRLGFKYFKGNEDITDNNNTTETCDIYQKDLTSYTDPASCSGKTDVYEYVALVKNTPPGTPENNQSTFNACQTVMSRSRLYNVNELLRGSLNYGTQDLFIKLKSLRPILLVVLVLTIYLLVQGTLSSADIGFNLASLISSRGNSSTLYWIGIFAGIAIPAIVSLIVARKQIERTNSKYTGMDITKTPYGTPQTQNKEQMNSDIAVASILIVLLYLFIAIVFYVMRDKSRSSYVKLGLTIIFMILLATTLFLLFYWAPIVSYASDQESDRAFGISKPLKVWAQISDNKEIGEVISNKYINRYLQRFFAIYALVALGITIIYLNQSNKPVPSPLAFFEGLMASCAILALPILWIFNWYSGIKYFVIYPVLLMIVRYLRYIMYFVLRNYYVSNPGLMTSLPKMRQEFTKPETYSPPWDLMGITLFKYVMKFAGATNPYSNLFVDPRDGYKDISGNSYVTGHIFRIMMKETRGPFDFYHHAMVFTLTFIISMFIIFSVVGSKNAF